MRLISSAEVEDFLAAKPLAVLHFDAGWDTRLIDLTRQTMAEAEAALGDKASFAEIDIDANVEFSKSIPVLNVPLIAYFRNGKLLAALVGAGQNVKARLERVLRGEPIGYSDGTT
jgi:thioredoxin-like negative regulator of GroEL